MSPADQLLVVRYQLGEANAHTALVERWYTEIWAYVRALAPDDAADDDACHDAWIDALRGLPSLAPEGCAPPHRGWAANLQP
ncbi:MAG: hypothetical protein K0V04_12310 [Deltaproteobacteria bacterium]|nr:hypothetical protein [Deltaproteobacteria bacterium]